MLMPKLSVTLAGANPSTICPISIKLSLVTCPATCPDALIALPELIVPEGADGVAADRTLEAVYARTAAQM